MREQKGYVFHRGKSWFLRYCDDFLQNDGTIKRKLVCKKLPVPYGGDHRTKKDVKLFVDELLVPINAGLLNPQSTMLVSDFIERIYLPEYVTKQLRPASLKQYREVWQNHLKPRMGKLTLRRFAPSMGRPCLRRSPSKRAWDEVPFATSRRFYPVRSNRPSASAS